ncbi:MAG: beta-propeller domain-containing protein, partial [Myxococcota bacterium]
MSAAIPAFRARPRFAALGFFVLASVAVLVTVGCGDDRYTDIVSDQTALVSYDACGDLETDLKEMLLGELESQYMQADSRAGFFDWADAIPIGGMADEELTADGGARAPSADNSAAQPPREEGEDFSGTNNQEAGVDEADISKTDGYNFYVLN